MRTITNRFVGAGIAMALTFSLIPAAYAAESEYADWNAVANAAELGTDYTVSGDTYFISTAKGLAYAASVVNGGNGDINITLNNDIHLEEAGVEYYPLNNEDKQYDNGWIPIGSTDSAFSGTFDGAGYSVYGIYTDKSQERGGLIGVLENGEVKDLKTKSGEVHGTYAAGIAAEVINGKIISCQNTVYVGGTEYAGGIVAKITGTEDNFAVIYDTSSSCYVGCDGIGGGIAGYCEYTSVIDCGSGSLVLPGGVSNDIYGNKRNDVSVDSKICGGLVGEAAVNVNIENCNNANLQNVKSGGTGGGIVGVISAAAGSYINNVTLGTISDDGSAVKGALYGEIKNAAGLSFDDCYYVAIPEKYPPYMYIYCENPCGAGDEELAEDTFTKYYQWATVFWVLDAVGSGYDENNKIITYLNENVTAHNAEDPEYKYTQWQEGFYTVTDSDGKTRNTSNGVGLDKTYTVKLHGTSFYIEDPEPTEVADIELKLNQNVPYEFVMYGGLTMYTNHFTDGFRLNEYIINSAGAKGYLTNYTGAIFTDLELNYYTYDIFETADYYIAVAEDEATAEKLKEMGIENVKDDVYGGEEAGTTFATGVSSRKVGGSEGQTYQFKINIPKGSYYIDENGDITETTDDKIVQFTYRMHTTIDADSAMILTTVFNNLYAPGLRHKSLDVLDQNYDTYDLEQIGEYTPGQLIK